MKCDKFDKLIYLFLDQRLKPNEESELKSHISECQRCQKKLANLELVESRAKGLQTKEPFPKYWDNFSNRVRDKISAREERSPLLGLKKTWENIFTFSPWKIRIAASLVSVVLVFVIGKLYIDYRGREIVPSAPMVQKIEKPQPYSPEIEKKEGFFIEKGKKKIKSPLSKYEVGKGATTTDQSAKKEIPKDNAIVEKEISASEGQIPSGKIVTEKKEIPMKNPSGVKPSTPPPQEIQPPTQVEESEEITPQRHEAKPTGAGIEKEIERIQEQKGFVQKRESGKEEKAPPKEETNKTGNLPEIQLKMKDIASNVRATSLTPSITDQYFVNEKAVPKVKEIDTLIQADELRKIIQIWKAQISENPADSLSQQGYIQVAICYYLLSRTTQDTTIMTEGTNLIEEYINQIKEQAIKIEVNDKLEKIKALGKK